MRKDQSFEEARGLRASEGQRRKAEPKRPSEEHPEEKLLSEKVLEVAAVARRGGWPRRLSRIPTSHARMEGYMVWEPRGIRKESSPTVSNGPANTDLSRKYSGPSERDTDLSRKVADLWVTGRTGKYRLRALPTHGEALQKRTIQAENLRRTSGESDTDPSDKGYRPLAQVIPTPCARQYRPLAQVLATPRASNTDRCSKNTDPSRK